MLAFGPDWFAIYFVGSKVLLTTGSVDDDHDFSSGFEAGDVLRQSDARVTRGTGLCRARRCWRLGRFERCRVLWLILGSAFELVWSFRCGFAICVRSSVCIGSVGYCVTGCGSIWMFLLEWWCWFVFGVQVSMNGMFLAFMWIGFWLCF